MATELVPVRRTLPVKFAEVTSITKPGFSVADLIEIAAATVIGGPAAGALTYAGKALEKPSFQATAATAYYATGTAANLCTMLQTLDTWNGLNQAQALERIAAALGNGRSGYPTPPTAVAKHTNVLPRALSKPPAPTDPPGTPTEYLVDCVCAKKKFRAVSVEILAYDPKTVRHKLARGGEFALTLGYVVWKIGPLRVGERQWINDRRTLNIAPFAECDGYDYFFYTGVTPKRTDLTVEVSQCS